jgi:glyoxylase-like metal-dependent hydrolase (beta-lactamase superfamily II)
MSMKSVLAAVAITIGGLGTAPLEAAAPTGLQIDVYNPGAKGIFPVSSEIVSGSTEVVLIDAQFQRSDAESLVAKIKATGKKLTTVYISHSDPDYYFGLDTITAAFPGVKVLATAQTVAAIKASKDGKLAYWGPILKENAPKHTVLPEPLHGDTLKVDGKSLRVIGLGPTSDRTFVWVPSRKAVLGGVVVFANAHVWVADTQTVESRRQWLQTLARIEGLKPSLVVPGHFLPNADGTQPLTVKSVIFTRDYLNTFEAEAAKAADSGALIASMKARYPSIGGAPSLEMSAKVIKGEVKWPAQ